MVLGCTGTMGQSCREGMSGRVASRDQAAFKACARGPSATPPQETFSCPLQPLGRMAGNMCSAMLAAVMGCRFRAAEVANFSSCLPSVVSA